MKNVRKGKRGRELDSKKHEKIACQNFLELYNKQLDKNIKFIKFGNHKVW